MKWFYESRMGVRLFMWWNNLCVEHIWVCWLYIAVGVVFGIIIHHKRKTPQKIVAEAEKSNINGHGVYLCDVPITPFGTGIFRTKIILPKVILQECTEDEVQTIILHEQTHIRLGHLWIFWIWDIFRVLLWCNPLLSYCTKYLKEDMENICDKVTIAGGSVSSYGYGKILLKSLRILKAQQQEMQGLVTFIGEQEFQSIKNRITMVAEYKPYKREAAMCIGAACILVVILGVSMIKFSSYGRYTENDTVVIYNHDLSQVLWNGSLKTQKAVILSEEKQSLNTAYLQDIIGENSDGIWIAYGGYSKMPGLGGGGEALYVDSGTMKKGGIQDISQGTISQGTEHDFFDFLLKFM
jgi:hypothetical protein